MKETAMTPAMRQVADDLFLLRGLTEEERDSLLEEAPLPIRFDKGESIYSSHSFRRALGLVLEGEAQVFRRDGEGHRVVMNHLDPGNIFGAAALFGEEDSYVTEIAALQATVVLFLAQDLVLSWMRKYFSVAENYMRFLTGRIRFLNEKIAGFTSGQADERLRRYLLENCREDGSVALPRSMSELAQMLNVGRSSLYRSLDSLAASGTIRREGRAIFIGNAQLSSAKAAIGNKKEGDNL